MKQTLIDLTITGLEMIRIFEKICRETYHKFSGHECASASAFQIKSYVDGLYPSNFIYFLMWFWQLPRTIYKNMTRGTILFKLIFACMHKSEQNSPRK